MEVIEDKYKYRSTDIACYLVSLASEKRIAMNITKVQKLLYIVYGIYLIITKKRLVDEHPQAWPYGPVFPRTREQLLNIDFSTAQNHRIKQDELHMIEHDEQLNYIMDFVLDKFGSWTAGRLSEWSHEKGSPWDKTTNRFIFTWGDEISDYEIRDYFNRIVKLKPKEANNGRDEH